MAQRAVCRIQNRLKNLRVDNNVFIGGFAFSVGIALVLRDRMSLARAAQIKQVEDALKGFYRMKHEQEQAYGLRLLQGKPVLG